MTLQRAESVASSGAASSFHEVALKSGILNQDPEQDDLLQTPSLEAGIFGVLFTLQEKDHQHVRYHWIVLKYFVTAWQIFSVILTPEFGWDINPRGTLWRVISVLSFRWFKDVGYNWYIAALYSFTGLLAVNLVLCVWVAWSFKEQKFDYVWPIKVVRNFAYVFLQVFDMTSLSFLQLGISCNYAAHGKTHLRMEVFPQYSCTRPPHIVNAVVSGLLLLVMVVMALLFNMAEVEVNPASKMPQALGHSGAEMTAFAIKALMTLVGVFLGWPKVAAVAYCVLAAWLAWEYLRWVPNLLLWVNCLKSGVATAMFSVASIQVLVVFLPDSVAHRLTVTMGLCLGPAFALGALSAWLRIRFFVASVNRAFRTADPEAVKPQDVYRFAHPRDVEVAARCARVWTDLYTLEKASVHRAEEIIKAGAALFPDSAFVALVYANFMLDMLGFSQTGAKQLEGVRKLSPSLMCRFMLFVRHQQATQKAASSTVGKGGNMDLLGYVEYQRKQRTVLRHHKDALQAMANFWRILGSSSISFTSLSRSLENIDNSIKKAESAYRVAMELYNNSPRLVRLYARFLETIKQDPWTAAQYYASADRLEENKDYNGQGPSLPDGTPISRIDEVEKGILVVNAFGDIQVANRKLHDMFGYKKGDLDGKNVTALMPPHEAKRHPAILRRYIDSGDKAPPYFRHPVLGIHRERVALTVRIAVSRASGLGEDSVFIGILELLPTEPGLGRVWVTPEGVIVCCDPGFVTCFGYHPEDVIGMHLDKLLRASYNSADGAASEPPAQDIWATNQANHDKHELVQRMLATAADGADRDNPFGTNNATLCRVLHKYDFAKACSIEVRRDLTDASVLEVRMRLVSDEPQLLMVVERKGAIRHMSGDLAKVLGVRAGGDSEDFGNRVVNSDHQVMLELMVEAPPCVLDDFLPSPWKAMHYKYRKYIKGGCPALSGAWGCRAAVDDNSVFVGPTMRLVGMHGKPVYVHVAVSSREEEGEPMHVVRMARSSIETATAERRVRMRVNLEGVVQELEQHSTAPVHADPAGLFGFPADELVGCRFGDFLSLPMLRTHVASARQTPELDLLAEAEAAVAGLAVQDATIGGVGGGFPLPDELAWEPLDLGTYDAMVTNALQTPGISWRVSIVSPRVASEAASLANPTRTAAVLAKRTKQAILKLDVVVPPPGSRDAVPDKLVVHAELWIAEAVTGVLEVDGAGRVSGVLEEEVRPPGLLFGLPKEDLVGAQLGSLLRFLPGQSPVGLLTDSGVAKKSSLKASSKKGKVAVKVGPVHYLEGFHRDHQPLSLGIQVVGKPGPGNPVIAVIRFAGPNAKRPAQGAAAGAGADVAGGRSGGALAAGAGAAGSLTHPKGAHIMLAVQELSRQQSIASRFGGGGAAGSASFSRLRQPSMSRSIDMIVTASLNAGPRVSTAAAAPPPPPLLTATAGRNASLELAPRGASEVTPPPPPPRLSLSPVTTPRVAAAAAGGAAGEIGLGSSGAAAPAAGSPAAAVLPGANALAAGVAGLMKAKSMSGGGGSGGSSSPEKPESPAPPAPSRLRPSAALARKAAPPADAAAATAAATGGAGALPGVPAASGSAEEERGLLAPVQRPKPAEARAERKDGKEAKDDEGGGKGGGGKGGGGGGLPAGASAADLKLETLSLAAGEAGSEEGADVTALGGVKKWVSTDGKFYRNRIESVDGMNRADGADPDDDDDDGAGSFGGLSRATSSHFASPRGSLYGGPDGGTEYDDQQSHATNHPPVAYGQAQYGGYPYGQQQYGNQYSGGPHPHHHGGGAGGGPHPYYPQHQHHYGNQQYGNTQYGNSHPQGHPMGGGPHPYHQHYYGDPYGNPYGNHQYGNQYGNSHPHNQHPQGQMHPHQQRYGPGGGGGGGGGAGPGGGGGGDWEGGGGGNRPAAHRARRSSFLQSGSLGADAARAPDAMSLDQGDDSDGDSEISGITGGSDDSGAEDPADYKRGKRYRKLIKLMNSPQAKKAMVRLKIHTVLAVLAAVGIHVLSFALIITSINKQSHALDQLAEAGGGQRYLQRALVAVRALDQVYKGKGSADTYGAGDTEAFAIDLLSYSDKYRDVSKGLLQVNGGKTEELFYTHTLQVWSGVNATTQVDVYEQVTIWDMLTRVYVSAKAVFQGHAGWHAAGLAMSSVLPVEFLLRSGQSLSAGMRPVLDTLLDSAVRWTHAVNQLQLTFLLVEGLCVAGCCAAGLMYMLKSAFDKRYQLYETFLSIPIGLTRALAAQTTHLLDDESDSQSEDEDERERYEDGPPSALPPSTVKRKTLFEESTTVLDAAAGSGGTGGTGGGGGERGVGGGGNLTSDDDDRSPGGALESRLRENGRKAGADFGDGRGAAGRRLHRGRSSKRFMLQEDYDSSFGPLGDLSLLTPTADPSNATLRSMAAARGSLGGGRLRLRVAALCCCVPFLRRWWRPGAVQPMSPGPFNAGGPESATQPRRTLVRNSKVAKGMLSIVVLYSLLVILFYAVNYIILLNVTDQVALQAVADQNSERTYRAVFYAQELVAEEDPAAIPGRVGLLHNATIALRDAYYTMRMGAKAWTVVGFDVERFTAVEGGGLVKGSPEMFDIFYADATCLRLPEHGPCLKNDYRYYEVTHSGADGMMIQLLTELGGLADEAMAAVVNATVNATTVQLPDLNSSRWDFIYNVGTVDLNDANLRIAAQHITDVKAVLKVVVVLHVVLLLLLMALFLCFLVMGYLPLLHRMDKEKRRIAEMMSQLPTELDVMRLFSTALIGTTKGAVGHLHRRHSQIGGAGGGGGGSNRTASTSGAGAGDGDGSIGPVLPGSPAALVAGAGAGDGAGASAAAAAAVTRGGEEVVPWKSGEDALGGGSGGGGGGAGAAAADAAPAGGVSKGYQAWKDILARASASGAIPNTANTAVTSRAKSKPVSQFL